MERSSTVPATEANTGQSYLRARTSSRSLISALSLALPVGRLGGKATPPHSYSRPLMEEKRGHRFPFHTDRRSTITVGVRSLSGPSAVCNGMLEPLPDGDAERRTRQRHTRAWSPAATPATRSSEALLGECRGSADGQSSPALELLQTARAAFRFPGFFFLPGIGLLRHQGSAQLGYQ